MPFSYSADDARLIAGYTPAFGSQPGIVNALASSGATSYQIEQVGAYTEGLEVAKRVKLAREAGTTMQLSDTDRGLLTAIGEPFSDVDSIKLAEQRQQQNALPEQHASFARTLWAGVKAAINGPLGSAPVQDVFEGLNRAADIVNTGARNALEFGGLPGAVSIGGAPTSEHVGGQMAENIRGALDRGYNPDSFSSMAAFLSRGKQVYHNLDPLRKQYGPEQVRRAQAFLEDKKNFYAPNLSLDELAARAGLSDDPEFIQLVKEVDSSRISPGRDLAAGFGLNPGDVGYGTVSGLGDTAWTLLADPTLVVGKAAGAVKFARYGIRQLNDTDRVAQIMTRPGAVRNGFEQLLEQAKIIRSGDQAAQAAAYARVSASTPDLVPVLDEVLGNGVRKGRPIENYDELVDHITATGALVRMRNGMAASERMLMPGRLNKYGYRQVRGAMAAAASQRGSRTIDLGLHASKMMEDGVDELGADLNLKDASPDAQKVGEAVLKYRKTVAGRRSTAIKRFSTLQPGSRMLDLGSSTGSQEVKRFASLYLPRSHANALAAQFAAGDIAARRAIYESMLQQTIHAAGISKTASGRRWMTDLRARLDEVNAAQYTAAGDDADLIKGVDGAPDRKAAIYSSQTTTMAYLPSFEDLSRVAAKVSVYDYTMKSMLESAALDRVMGFVRLGWIAKPANAARNVLEETGLAGLKGLSPAELLKARSSASMAQKEAARRALADGEVEVDADLPRGTFGEIWHGKIVSNIRRAVEFGAVKVSNDDALKYANELTDGLMYDEVSEALGMTTGRALRGDVDSAPGHAAREILGKGYVPGEVSWKPAGYELGTADGLAGAKAWAHNLKQRMGAAEGNHVLRATLESLQPRMLDEVRAGARPGSLETLGETRRRIALREGATDVPAATTKRDELINFMVSDSFKEQRSKLERFRVLRDGTKVDPLDAAMTRRAATELADTQIADLTALLTTTTGGVNRKLIEKLSRGEVPTAKDLSTVRLVDRPLHIVRPAWIAEAPTKLDRVQQLADAGYEFTVGRPLRWASRTPIYHANYARARKAIDESGYHKMLTDQGISDALAQDTVQQLARMHAMDATMSMVDNPRVRSQMVSTSRNFFSFWRAQEDFLRRWGRALIEDPTRLRKMQLAIEGATDAGIVTENEQGEKMLNYPGSGHAINLVSQALRIFGGDVVLPMQPNLSTKLQFVNAGVDRPFIPTVSPVAAIPLRLLGHFGQNSTSLLDAREITEGQVGAQRGWWGSLLPTVLTSAFKAMNSDDRESQLATATRNALLNLAAAGKAPGAGASPAEQQQFIEHVRTQVKNQLMMRWFAGLFLVGAPGLPQENTGANQASIIAQGMGAATIKDEFRVLANKVGFDNALAVWTKSRPDDLIYTVGTTTKGTGVSEAPSPTDQVYNWLLENKEMVGDFKGIAAYFAPDGPGDFSQDAWQAELQLGLRKHKTASDFYTDIVVKGAEAYYYKMKDARDKAIADAEEAGDTEKVKAIRAAYSDDVDRLKAQNPLLAAKWAQRSQNATYQEQGVQQLELFLKSSYRDRVPQADKLEGLVTALRGFQNYTNSVTGNSNQARAQREQAKQLYVDFVSKTIGTDRMLQSVVTGLFPDVQ